MAQITRKFSFPAGHRLMNHEGGCAYLHGHNWDVEVTISSPGLDGVGRVIDFSQLKKLVGKWIDDNWDHAFIINGKDVEVEKAIAPWSKIYKLPEGINPSSENLSEHLFKQIQKLLPAPLEVVQVVLHETSNCRSSYPDRVNQYT